MRIRSRKIASRSIRLTRMRCGKFGRQYPNDPDVGALFAEAMMDLRPWDQWTPEGQPNPGTDEILATLDAVLKLNPNHPFANHLYIHAVEASRNPERADAAADRLRNLQPGLAHNVHMPSHIDIRRGPLAAGDRHQRESGRGRPALPQNRRAADGFAAGLCRAQPPHAGLWRVDDRAARGRHETCPRDGRGNAGRRS